MQENRAALACIRVKIASISKMPRHTREAIYDVSVVQSARALIFQR